ncbi:hypothetical protein PPERSA_00965 [Pseudocohnilembus persalinus]|uniref:Transmembrane protein n=1 Tax=Pseudocohnilembus persalinus TaxID=266149 RepID=A0A0V0R8H4_PSEPJ|nr:hypothetical protein PPERSA_00965 [Pseudocohnilembus persalinus]|eukprot:KRX10795.1 hypothetical protein PPERSA_00965 [Pseudocohnilembus persalinus]
MSCASNTTDKFMIELLSLPLLVICFLEIEKHYDLLYLHQFKGYYDNITLKFNIIFYNALLTIVYLLGVFVFCIYYDSQSLNNFSIKIKKYSVQFKSILGFFQLFLILCTIYPAYLCLTDYRSVFQHYLENCPSELENIQSNYVVNYSIYDKCHTKYEQEEDITCPSENPGECFKDFNLCSKSNLQLVWEHELVKEPEQNVILACVNKSCCSVLTQIFAYPKLQYSIYCMFYIIISLPMVFFLIFFKVTTNKTKQHRPTSSNIPDELGDTKIFERRVRETYLKYIFLTGRYLFIIIFVFGSIYNILTYDKHSQIPTREKHYKQQLDFQDQHNLINYNVNQNHNSIYSNQYMYNSNQLQFSEYQIEKQNTGYIQHEHESEEIYIQKILNTEIQNENEIQKESDLQLQQQNRNQNLIKTQQHKFHKSLLKQHNFQVENKQLNQIQSFSIIVHDIQSDKPIDQVQVTVFKLDEIQHQYYQCNMEFHNQPMFLYVTSENGQAIFPLEFENLNQQIKMIIFVEKKGYTGNCRIVTVTQQNIKFYQNFDIALGVNLSQNDIHSIILAEWDPQYINDIDLYVNFGHYQGNDDTKFLCEIGVHQEQCGGVYFQGDNMVKLYGKSSESILFEKIGGFQYLVFINTYVQDLEKKINNTQNSANYGTKLSQAKPVIKYYTKNYTWPVKTILNWEDLSHLDKYVKFSILQFCIKGEKQDLRAYQIPSQYKIWSISEEGPVYDRVKTSDLPSTYNKLKQYQDNQNQQIKNITHQKDQYICSLDSLEI